MRLDHLPWPLRPDDEYENACIACEINIVLRDEGVKRIVSTNLEYMQGENTLKWRGRTLKADLLLPGQPQLLAGDRLEPSNALMDVAFLESLPAGARIVFWRETRDPNKAVVDSVCHRCPLLTPSLHTSLGGSIVIDTLHTLNFGPWARWTSAALLRLVAANHGATWQSEGTD